MIPSSTFQPSPTVSREPPTAAGGNITSSSPSSSSSSTSILFTLFLVNQTVFREPEETVGESRKESAGSYISKGSPSGVGFGFGDNHITRRRRYFPRDFSTGGWLTKTTVEPEKVRLKSLLLNTPPTTTTTESPDTEQFDSNSDSTVPTSFDDVKVSDNRLNRTQFYLDHVNRSVLASLVRLTVVRRAVDIRDMQIFANIGSALSRLVQSTTREGVEANASRERTTGETIVNGSGCNISEAGAISIPQGSTILAVILILLSVFGLLGNLLSMVIFLHIRMRKNPINLLLSALSIMDFFVNACFIPTFALPVMMGYDLRGEWSKMNICIVYLTYPLGMVAQFCSNWFFVAITVERFWAVCHPLSVIQVDSGRARRIIGVVVTSGVLYNLTRFWEFDLDFRTCPGEVLTRHLLRADTTYVMVYVTAMYAIFIFLVPFVVLTVLNVCIIRSIRYATKMRSRMTAAISTNNSSLGLVANDKNGHLGGSRQSIGPVKRSPGSGGALIGGGGGLHHSTKLSPQEAESQRKTTIMILIITFKFIACNILPCALHILESVNSVLIYGRTNVTFYVIMTSYILFLCYSSSNCFIYWAFSGKYRNLARLLFRCQLHQPQQYLTVPTTCTGNTS